MLLLNEDLVNIKKLLHAYFNTSYVVIKPVKVVAIAVFLKNFNTSYVVIKPVRGTKIGSCKFISIHLMLLLNPSK